MLIAFSFVLIFQKVFSPCVDQCSSIANTHCTLYRNSHDCYCKGGYYRNRNTNECDDSNECSNEGCDTRIFSCYNEPGTYRCPCHNDTDIEYCKSLISNKRMNYQGCIKMFVENLKIKLKDVAECRSHCVENNYSFLAIKENQFCSCGDGYDSDDVIPDDYCHLKCHKSDVFCGGEEFYSVYLVSFTLPSYRGCFEISGSVDSEKVANIAIMTIAQCLVFCDDYTFANIRNGTECRCTNTTEEIGSNMCLVRCRGQSDRMCGGLDQLTVYGTCNRWSHRSVKCSSLFHCGSFDEHGYCDSTCDEGFVGKHCIERRNKNYTVMAGPILFYWLILVVLTGPVILICLVFSNFFRKRGPNGGMWQIYER